MHPTESPADRPPRLTMRQFWRDVGDELLSLDRGLPYTFKQLLTAPGAAIREYVEWRDPRMTKPLRFFIVCVAIVALAGALQRLGAPPPVEPVVDPRPDAISLGVEIGRHVTGFVRDSLLLALLLLVPAITAGTEGAFRDRGYTAAELWVFSLYVLAICAVLVRVLTLMLWAVPPPTRNFTALLAGVAYYVWVCCGFFTGPRVRTAAHALVAVLAILALETAFLAAVAGLSFAVGRAFT